MQRVCYSGFHDFFAMFAMLRHFLCLLSVCILLCLCQGDQEAAQVLLDAGADAAATDSLGRAASDMVKARGGAMFC